MSGWLLPERLLASDSYMVLFGCFVYTVTLKWCSSHIKKAGTLSHRAFLSSVSLHAHLFFIGNLIQVIGIAFGS